MKRYRLFENTWIRRKFPHRKAVETGCISRRFSSREDRLVGATARIADLVTSVIQPQSAGVGTVR